MQKQLRFSVLLFLPLFFSYGDRNDTPSGLYKDLPDGKPAGLELYRWPDDRQESNNRAQQEEAIVRELRAIWEKEAVDFPPPVRWGRDKWEGIAPKVKSR